MIATAALSFVLVTSLKKPNLPQICPGVYKQNKVFNVKNIGPKRKFLKWNNFEITPIMSKPQNNFKFNWQIPKLPSTQPGCRLMARFQGEGGSYPMKKPGQICGVCKMVQSGRKASAMIDTQPSLAIVYLFHYIWRVIGDVDLFRFLSRVIADVTNGPSRPGPSRCSKAGHRDLDRGPAIFFSYLYIWPERPATS